MAYDKKYKRRHAARRFGRLRLKRGSAAFPESGGILMYQQEYERWLAAELEDKDLKPELLSIQGIDAEIQDRFAVELEFGTAGLRGVLGAGTNRMNIYMVRKATQGLANYLNKQGGKKSVAISYDSRIKSDVFAREAARVLAGNGVKAVSYTHLLPVNGTSRGGSRNGAADTSSALCAGSRSECHTCGCSSAVSPATQYSRFSRSAERSLDSSTHPHNISVYNCALLW